MNADVLPLVAGHPALDLVNSKERGIPLPNCDAHDFLVDTDALLVWARRAGLIADAEAQRVRRSWARHPGSARDALRAVRKIREALHVALLAATGLGPTDARARELALEHLHAQWLAAVSRARLVINAGGEPPIRLDLSIDPAFLLADRAADAALDILRSDELARLRCCPIDSGGCGWLFLDRTRNRSRRWCRMADCGTQVKARRLTERRRAARTSSPSNRPTNNSTGRLG